VRGYLTPLTAAEDALIAAGKAAEGREPLEVQVTKVPDHTIAPRHRGSLALSDL
jgi:hypothetical protein